MSDVAGPELADETVWSHLALTGDVAGDSAELLEIDASAAMSLRMTGVQLVKPRITDCRFERCELSGVVFEQASLERVEFVDCRLSGAVWSDVRMRHVRFRSCRMDGTVLRMAVGSMVRFESCQLDAADLYGAELPGIDVIDCSLAGADFSHARIAGASLHGSDLTDLTGAAAFRDVSIDAGQVVPMALLVFDELGISITDRD